MHPYGISVLVPQMSFCGETRVIVTKCKLLYQPSSLHNWFHHKLVKKKKQSPMAVTISLDSTCVLSYFLKWKKIFLTSWVNVLLIMHNGKNVSYLNGYSWFSHDITKIQTKKLSLLLSFYFHVVLQHLKTYIQTNFRFKRVLRFVIQDTWISRLSRDAAFSWRQGKLLCGLKTLPIPCLRLQSL